MRYLAILLLVFICRVAPAQSLVDTYYEFSGAITEGRQTTALVLADKILPEVSTLSARRQAIFYYQLASLHETRKNPDLAIDFYKRTLKLEPDYYVPHLALGYLYLAKANLLVPMINAEKSNLALREKYINDHKSYFKKLLPHLEKAMACDPNEQVLASIESAYSTLKDQVSFELLDSRLRVLDKNCVTLLKED